MPVSLPPAYTRTKLVEKPKLGPLLPVIDAILEADQSAPVKQRHTAKRIFERLRDEHGFAGGYTPARAPPARTGRPLVRVGNPLHRRPPLGYRVKGQVIGGLQKFHLNVLKVGVGRLSTAKCKPASASWLVLWLWRRLNTWGASAVGLDLF